MLTSAPLFALVSTWLTPFWLFALGITLGLVALLAIGGALWGAGKKFPAIRPFTDELPVVVREGLLMPVLVVAGVLAFVTVLPIVLDVLGIPTVNYSGFLNSLVRLPFVHDNSYHITIPAGERREGDDTTTQKVALSFRAAEVASLELKTNHEVLLKIPNESATRPGVAIPLKPDEKWKYVRGTQQDKGQENPFAGEVRYVDAVSDSKESIQLDVVAGMDVEFPQVRFVLGMAGAFLALFALYFAIRFAFPKVSAVAVAACKEGMGQPLFYLMIGLGLFCLLFFVYIPLYTFGEDIKMYKEGGTSLILILSIFVALWTASVSVSEEIEGKTAVTVLSKPISRRQFVLGKFLGLLGPVAVMFIILGTFFLLTTSFKVVYDARETAKGNVVWTECFSEMVSVLPGLALFYMEVIVLTSISVALSTRLPMLPNLLICFSIYALGNLVPQIVGSSLNKFPLVAFIGQLSATILPVLDHFNIQAAIASGTDVPGEYLWYTLGYCALFSTMALLVGLFLFEDRDVA